MVPRILKGVQPVVAAVHQLEDVTVMPSTHRYVMPGCLQTHPVLNRTCLKLYDCLSLGLGKAPLPVNGGGESIDLVADHLLRCPDLEPGFPEESQVCLDITHDARIKGAWVQVVIVVVFTRSVYRRPPTSHIVIIVLVVDEPADPQTFCIPYETPGPKPVPMVRIDPELIL